MVDLNCHIGLMEVKHFGHVIISEGIKPDPVKISVLYNMTNPTRRAELETLLAVYAGNRPHSKHIENRLPVNLR